MTPHRAATAATGMLALLLAAVPAWGGGYSIFEQGTKAMGMAGAFTAQADDGSAMFHNVAGLAFQRERSFQAGTTIITSSRGEFEGTEPFPGTGTSERLSSLGAFVPHLYWVEPRGERLTFGVGMNAPFGLLTDWKDKDGFSGRFISTRGELTVIDLLPSVGYRVNDRIGVGFGIIARFAEVSLSRRQPAINPFTGAVADIAAVDLESDLESGFGFQLGVRGEAGRLLWGASYRSAIEIDFGGDGRFTQLPSGFPVFDALVAGSLPFGRAVPIATEVEFPDAASVGVGYRVRPNLLFELDVNRTGWSSFDRVEIRFTDGSLPSSFLTPEWDDSTHVRLGVEWRRSARVAWRFGIARDESPQPDENVGPLLPDSDRDVLTVGYGRSGGRVDWDAALMYLSFDDRTTFSNEDNFNGSYFFTGWLFGLTFGF